MKTQIKDLGKVAVTVNGTWQDGVAYDRLSIVDVPEDDARYISIKDVPANIYITNAEYWFCLYKYKPSVIDEYSIVDKPNPKEFVNYGYTGKNLPITADSYILDDVFVTVNYLRKFINKINEDISNINSGTSTNLREMTQSEWNDIFV